MGKEDLRECYEATGDERHYNQAKPLYEQALADNPDDPDLLVEYGYLTECHGRYAIRAAAQCYQRAIDVDPRQDKPHLQLISALSALGELDTVIPRYERQVAQSPDDPRGYRLLATAYVRADYYQQATRTIRAGLAITPDDPALNELRGDVYAATGHPDEALASWRRAFALATDDYGISMRYSSAFLLEGQGLLAEAAGEWRFIIGWLEEHGEVIHLDWPKRELHRIEAQLAAH